MTRLFLFDTTHHALHAEQVGLQSGLGVQVVPAPAGADAKCDLALECLAEDADGLETAMREAGVAYRSYSRGNLREREGEGANGPGEGHGPG